MIAIDYETHLISDGNIFPKPVCLSWYNGQDTGLLDREESREYLKKILTTSLITGKYIVAHNAVFECGVTVTHYPELAELVFDALDKGIFYCTKINESLWNIQRDKPINKLTLADLVKFYFRKDISATKGEDAWRMRYSELDGKPISEWPKEAIDYAIDDSIWAYKVQESQLPIDQNLALKSAVYLNLMGAQGFRIEQERVKTLESEIWEFLTPRYDFLVKEGYADYLPKQKQPRKQIKKLQEYIAGLDINPILTSKGNTAVSGEAIEAYMSQIDDPIVKTFGELSKYEKILTAFLSRLRGAEKIYSQYSTTKSTGRTSSSSSTLFKSVNIQQMPRQVPDVTYDIRNCFAPRPGFKIFSIDYSGLELCSAAHQLYKTINISHMRDALNEGDKPTDMHSKLAAKIKGISYEEFMKNKKEYKEDRQKAKPINLGFPGGIGYDTMRYLMNRDGIKTYFNVLEKSTNEKDLQYYLFNLGMDDIRIKRLNKKEWALVQDELVLLKKHVFGLYPDLEQFLKQTHKRFLTGKTKWIKNEFDEWEEEEMYKYQVADFVRDNCTYTALCNGYLMQTPSAIGAQRTMNKLIRTYWNSDVIIPQAFIHDEVVGEVREDCYDELEKVSNIMMEEMQTVLTSVRISVEASVSDYWQKADGFWTKQYWRDPR